MESNGIILIDKKAGISTTYQDGYLKRVFNTKKVGHAGTLDPFATGLIICGINKGTKALSFFDDADKDYTALLKLGVKTDSGDRTGKIIASDTIKVHTEAEIKNALNTFLGETMQVPPMYSAIKKNGIPLYKYARDNIDVAREPRRIIVKSIELVSYKKDCGEIIFSVSVSKGTYIRTLAENLAEKLGEFGSLLELRRTRVGRFSIKDAYMEEELTNMTPLIQIKDLFIDTEKKVVTANQEERVRNGADVLFLDISCLQVLLLSASGEALALYHRADNGWYSVSKEFI